MGCVAFFPHLSDAEFQSACTTLIRSYASLPNPSPGNWISVETKCLHPQTFLRITKEHSLLLSPSPQRAEQDQSGNVPSLPDEGESLGVYGHEEDPEALSPSSPATPLIHYDIILSPTYRVPTLYVHIADPLHRFPPTMSTLYTHVLDPAYINQTKGSGVLGGITTADHPVEARPVFFVHPCRTAEVMLACAGGKEKDMEAWDYLVMWIGAMGKAVGLDVPKELVVRQGR
ncbi:hypothetical protein BU23DRAFT_470806 [Bimuria novae-zelandiae CBS 107.79]|uniref:Ubiquitin-like-conjugating enzyme ATG10 n=1 Tax=Bimuria novae-zelandiae CBS 107.79 TaxID=1447943 RepID=A0A6A5V581_9PLEO|nr:hypothetical protein BU23DRAFT_470806 [Bimuria novae-zelandiae CBS 107.79]